MSANTPKRSESELAEFSALRQEIEYRTNAQLALISLNLTAVGTLAGFFLSNQADPLLLLLLPILCPAIGMLWLDHAFTIQNIGGYIKDHLGFGWEELVRTQERRKILRFFVFGTPILLMFAGVPVFALIFPWSSLKSAWTWSLWSSGVVLVAGFLWFLTAFLVQPLREIARRKRKNG
jgi:hypothetical protein